MGGTIRTLCVLSIFCGSVLCFAPEGGSRRVLSILCTAVLITAVLGTARGSFQQAYALALGRSRERETLFLQRSEETRERLSRLVIEQELRTYILDKAEKLGVRLEDLGLRMRWETEGLWIPEALSASWSGEEAALRTLSRQIEAELGIPAERQQWNGNG